MGPGFFTQYGGYIFLTTVALMFALVLVAGMLNEGFRADISDPNKARGFITFLIAFASTVMIMIMFISTLWLDSEALKDRFPLEKDVLTVLVGILGTILGYFFGQRQTGGPREPPDDRRG
jgi:purine-cytosine permease-like protein